MASLEDLLNVRSQRALRLEAHLHWLAEGHAWTRAPWLVRAGLTLDQVYIEPYVVQWGGTPETREDEERRALGPRGQSQQRRQPWQDVWRGLHRAVLLGRPGEGKSTVLEQTCRRVAAEGHAAWVKREIPLDMVPVALWLRAEDIVRAGSVEAAIREATALREVMPRPRGRARPRRAARRDEEPPPLTPAGGLTGDEIVAALDRPTTWLFVDALDEAMAGAVDGTATARAVSALASLAAVKAHLVLSVRTYAWQPEHLPFAVTAAASRDGGGAAARPDGGTSAPAGTLDVYELDKLTLDQRRDVVNRWCSGAEHDERRDRVVRLLDEAPLRELTNNALLLTLLCSAALVEGRDISAETRRVELFGWLVADIVARGDRYQLDPNSDIVQQRVGILARAAWALWEGTGGDAFTHVAWEAQVQGAARRAGLSAGARAALLREVERAGLLVRDGARRRFFPQTAYEYLAGAGLVARVALAQNLRSPKAQKELREVGRVLADRAGDATWREAGLFAIGHLSRVPGGGADKTSAVVSAVLAATAATPAHAPGAAAALLGDALVEAGVRDPRDLGDADTHSRNVRIVSDDVRDAVVAALMTTMRNADVPGTPTHVPAVVRARAGAALGWIGDPRFDPDAFWLPVARPDDPLRGFRFRPAGSFVMGHDYDEPPDYDDIQEALGREKLPHKETVAHPFLMACWPVTVAQFGAYLRSVRGAPSYWRALKGPPNTPVVEVTHTEAEAYCAWLEDQVATDRALAGFRAATARQLGAARVQVRLPTWAEWEYVATGGREGRRYPYGMRDDADCRNANDTGIGRPSAVGAFRRGAALWRCEPCSEDEEMGDVEDLAGNVSEWLALSDRSDRVVRGGSFALDFRYARAAYRQHIVPLYTNIYVGFRVVVCALRT